MYKEQRTKLCRQILWHCLLVICFVSVISQNATAQERTKKKQTLLTSVSNSISSNYSRIGTTMLYYCYAQSYNGYLTTIDVQGQYNGNYYQSTYSNCGYDVAMKINNESPISVDCQNGTNYKGVSFNASVIQQGELARICYAVTNNNAEDVVISLGTHADVMIGNNDRAPISRRIDTNGNTYGLTMKDGNGAQLCVLFGAGLAGVTSVSDFWFGYWNLNHSLVEMAGNYSTGSNYMQENGSYDSGMGWCWKDRTIPAGATVVFSYLIGVGEVNLEPSSSFDVTPDDPEGWNDLSRPHKLALEGVYESPAGLEGKIEYAVEISEEWIPLTELLPSGSTFNETVVVMFDPTREKHTIRFRTVDNVGNATALPSIEYIDVAFHQVSGITDMTYTGEPLLQTALTCDLPSEEYVATNYQNNVNVGTASFNIEGVFPYTIGRKTYNFNIIQQTLAGSIVVAGSGKLVYNGDYQYPVWYFTEGRYSELEEGTDYTVSYSNNMLPGQATVTVKGKGNYTGTLSVNFEIDKAPLSASLYSVSMPQSDISYDGQPHGAIIEKDNGVGEPTVQYSRQGSGVFSEDKPVEEGAYDAYLSFADGTLYYGMDKTYIGSFTIYTFSESEWASLQTLYEQLSQSNPEWAQKWQYNIEVGGILSVGNMPGIAVEEGHVSSIDLSEEGLCGAFPYMLLTFPYVKVLDLCGNSFTGDVNTVINGFNGYITEQAPEFVSCLQKLDISDNGLTGNIGLLANGTQTVPSLLSRFPDLYNLDASGNKFNDVYPPLPPSITELDLSCQIIDVFLNVDLSDLNLEALSGDFPTILTYNHQEQSYNTTPYVRIANYSPDTQSSGYSIDRPYWGVDAYMDGIVPRVSCVGGNNSFTGSDGDVLYVSYPICSQEVDNSYCITTIHFINGDANFIGGVDVTDLQASINFIFGSYNTYPFNFTAADTYKDGRLNVQDVVCTANIIINTGSLSSPSRELVSAANIPSKSQNEPNASLFVSDGKLILRTDKPIAAIDITFETNGEISFTLDEMGYEMLYRENGNCRRILAYTLSDLYIPCGETVIAEVQGTAPTSMSVKMADASAQKVSASYYGNVTLLNAIGDDSSDLEYYTPTGIRLDGPVNGINIVRRGIGVNTESKVIYIK